MKERKSEEIKRADEAAESGADGFQINDGSRFMSNLKKSLTECRAGAGLRLFPSSAPSSLTHRSPGGFFQLYTYRSFLLVLPLSSASHSD